MDLLGEFKYISVNYKKDFNFISADLIISKEFLLLLEFTSSGFNIIHKFDLINMTKLIPNHKNKSVKIFDKIVYKTEGLELKSESYSSVMTLIDDLVKLKKKIK
jgi:hypothetical protein